MPEYVYLSGAEDVKRAASSMREAASEMQGAVGNLGHELYVQRQFLDDWILRFTDVLANHRDELAKLQATRETNTGTGAPVPT